MAPPSAATFGSIGAMTRRSGAMVVLALVLVVVAIWGLTRVPTAFLPNEDQGYLIVIAQLPDGASKERTDAVMQQIQRSPAKCPGVEHVVTVSGISILDNLRQPRQRGRRLRRPQGLGRAAQGEGTGSAIDHAALNGALQARAGGLRVRARRRRRSRASATSAASRCRSRSGTAISTMRCCRAWPTPSSATAMRNPALQRLATTFRAGAPQSQRHRRPHQGRDARHHGRQCVFRAVGLCRLELRGPVQQVRPRLPGLHAGAAPTTAPPSTTSAISRSGPATEP